MNAKKNTSKQWVLACSALLVFLAAGCARPAVPCPSEPFADLSGAAAFAGDDALPFRFPLDDVTADSSPSYTLFCAASSGPESSRKYHAAEDYFRPPGTPVYSIADGEIAFSGRMGGYGWLIIVDHPQANLYSLYGHLSPSRDRLRRGPVEKGTLLAYLGDADENGGSTQQPLEPHLHLGVRAGQRADYPGKGAWRWQAGWIQPCPKGLGWLQPSAVLTAQEIPAGGFPAPASGGWNEWGVELLFAGIYGLGAVCALIYALRKGKPVVPLLSGATLLAAGGFFYVNGWKMSSVILAMGALSAATGVVLLVRRSKRKAE